VFTVLIRDQLTHCLHWVGLTTIWLKSDGNGIKYKGTTFSLPVFSLHPLHPVSPFP